MSQVENTWGVISALAKQHQISRTFIYSQLSTFKKEAEALFFPKEITSITRAEAEAFILAYRFEGRCSIEAISTLMKRNELPFYSHGYISEFLTKTGQLLSNTLETETEAIQFVTYANDEVYSKSQPILMTVDPISSAILRIELADNRTAEKWSNHYEAIIANGFIPTLSTSDSGMGICAANKNTLKGIPWQLDTFHSVAHRLGDWSRRLERTIETAIERAHDREKTLDSAKNDEVIDKRLNRCFDADKAVEKAIELHENFSYLYQIIIHQLKTFDSAGNLREHHNAKGEIEAALDLMETLKHKAINKEVVSVRKALPHFLTYFAEAKTAVENCQKLTDNQEALTTLYLAWQWDKAVIKAKDIDRKHQAIEQRQFYLELAALFIGDQESMLKLKEEVYAELDYIIQASSMVECINSILRPYLNNSRNQVTQEFLNIFMFYHNHRRYHAGKRKGKTPMEILTKNEQKEDWITLLQKKIKIKSQSILVA